MNRPLLASLAVLSIALVSVGCKKGGDESSGGAAGTTSATTVTSAAPAVTPAAVAPTPAPTPTQPPISASDVSAIKGCCAALHDQANKAAAKDKPTLTTAASVCDGIAARVASGATSRSSALTSIRAAMRNGTLPGACH